MDQHTSVSPDQVKWVAAPPAFPKGAQIAVLAGDPSKEGMYVIRLKAPAGYKVMPHSHPFDENVTGNYQLKVAAAAFVGTSVVGKPGKAPIASLIKALKPPK